MKKFEEEQVSEKEVSDFLEEIKFDGGTFKKEKVRKKNAKTLLISVIGLVVIAVVYFGNNNYTILSENEQHDDMSVLPPFAPLKNEILPSQREMKRVEEDGAKRADNISNKADRSVISNHSPLDNFNSEEKLKPLLPYSKAEFVNKPSRKKLPPKKIIVGKENLVSETGQKGKYYIQLGAFVIKRNAEKLIQSLKNKGFSPINKTVKNRVEMFRVYTNDFKDQKKAEREIIKFKKAGIDATLKTTSNGVYIIQTGNFLIKNNAEKLKAKINEMGLPSKTIRFTSTRDIHKVLVGYFKTKKEAGLAQKRMGKQGFHNTLIIKRS